MHISPRARGVKCRCLPASLQAGNVPSIAFRPRPPLHGRDTAKGASGARAPSPPRPTTRRGRLRASTYAQGSPSPARLPAGASPSRTPPRSLLRAPRAGSALSQRRHQRGARGTPPRRQSCRGPAHLAPPTPQGHAHRCPARHLGLLRLLWKRDAPGGGRGGGGGGSKLNPAGGREEGRKERHGQEQGGRRGGGGVSVRERERRQSASALFPRPPARCLGEGAVGGGVGQPHTPPRAGGHQA